MKKFIDLPIQELSRLKKVHIEFNMTGHHYEQLATFNDDVANEQLILSILSDLVDENVDELTKQECIYLFTLVKISNLGSKLPVMMTCPHCQKSHKEILNLADVSIKTPKKKWKPRTIEWIVDGVKGTYTVLPPNMSTEIKLLDWLSLYRDISRKQIYEDKIKTIKYKMYMSMLHLADSNGKFLLSNVDDFERIDELMENNSYQSMANLHYLSNEVDVFGITPNIKTITCDNKECGGKYAFHFPILYGLCAKRESH